MKKTLLFSILASTLIYASGETNLGVSNLPTQTLNEEGEFISSIPMSFGLIGGMFNGDGDNASWEKMFGAELAFECLFSSDARSQLQYMYYDIDGVKMHQLSANPHFMFLIDGFDETVEFGVGPHVGVARVEVANENDMILTYGAGASIRSSFDNHLFVGAEARYEWTTDSKFEGKENLDNAKVFAKIGYSF